MKRFLILSLLFVFTMGVSAQGVFGVGDKKVDFTIGVGKVRHTGATFDQHVNMEWGVAKIADKFTIGVGFSVNNTYGGKVVGTIAGEYDYTYNVIRTTKTKNRYNPRHLQTHTNQKPKGKAPRFFAFYSAASVSGASVSIDLSTAPVRI